MKKYSIVIHPNNSVIEEVRQMKKLLASEIKWYPSKNSLAHITINEFIRDEIELERIKDKLIKIVTYLKPQEVHFDGFDNFPNGAFYLKPNETSRHYLEEIMNSVNKKFFNAKRAKRYEPHISIGRQISIENLEKAYRLFSKIPSISFTCDTIALRCFNNRRGQFDVLATFPFLGQESQDGIQGTLF